MRSVDAVVVGGGIVGLATARELAVRHRLNVLVAEREERLAAHQTGHNSGVVHSGLYYPAGSHKARLCVEGREALLAYCAERGVAHERCGKLVVAHDDSELGRLDELERRGRGNGLAGLERLDAAGVREHEPHARGVAGLWVPETGIADFAAAAGAMAADVEAAGGEILRGVAFEGARRDGAGLAVRLGGERVAAGLLVGCAGLESDRVARRCGLAPDVRIVPFRGEYFLLGERGRRLVRGLVYPVPDPALPFLGVHLTRRVDGRVEAGPNAVLAWRRDGYRPGDVSLRDAASMLAWPGFWRMARRQLATGWRELARSWSRRRFAAALRRLVPELAAGDLEPGGSGVRAQAVDRSGALVDDFAFAEGERMLHVLNAPSPAATASLAIGRELAERALGRV